MGVGCPDSPIKWHGAWSRGHITMFDAWPRPQNIPLPGYKVENYKCNVGGSRMDRAMRGGDGAVSTNLSG